MLRVCRAQEIIRSEGCTQRSPEQFFQTGTSGIIEFSIYKYFWTLLLPSTSLNHTSGYFRVHCQGGEKLPSDFSLRSDTFYFTFECTHIHTWLHSGMCIEVLMPVEIEQAWVLSSITFYFTLLRQQSITEPRTTIIFYQISGQ